MVRAVVQTDFSAENPIIAYVSFCYVKFFGISFRPQKALSGSTKHVKAKFGKRT